jgi:hypothetical protein
MRLLQEIIILFWEKGVRCTCKNCWRKQNTQVEYSRTSNSTGDTVSDSIGEQPTEGEKITQVDSAIQATLLGIKTSGNHPLSAGEKSTQILPTMQPIYWRFTWEREGGLGDQPPNTKPSQNTTTAEEERTHCSAEGRGGENLNKHSDGEIS